MHTMKTAVFGLLAMLAASAAQSAEINIQWQEPEKFRDIEANTEQSQQKYQRRVIDELGKHIKTAADKHLPPDHTLNLTVTDVDLAGDVEYFFTRFGQSQRVVRDLYFPSIEFNYELLDARGQTVESDTANVKDMGFQFAGVRRVREAPLGYEKRMIDQWFSRNFEEYGRDS